MGTRSIFCDRLEISGSDTGMTSIFKEGFAARVRVSVKIQAVGFYSAVQNTGCRDSYPRFRDTSVQPSSPTSELVHTEV